jgi:hypothetical protein
MNKNTIRDVLLALGAAGTIAGCGGSQPVQSNEVPGATAAPTDMPAAPAATGAPEASTTPASTGAPEASGAPSAAPSAMPMAKEMPKNNHTVKVKDSSRKKPCDNGCGAGTCGTPCG